MLLRTLIISLLLILIFNKSNAQNFPIRFKHLTTADGLTSDEIYDIVQDKYGYIWSATGSGINRYDGVKVKQYEHDPSNPYSLPAELCFLSVDRMGNLWVHSEKGLSLFDAVNGRFVPVILPNGKRETDYITAVYFDEEYNIWYFTGAGTLKKGNIQKLKVETVFKFKTIANCIVEDSKKRMWLLMDKGLVLFDTKKKQAVFYHTTHTDVSDKFYSFYEDEEHNIWLGDWGRGIHQFDPKTGKFTTYSINNVKNGPYSNYVTSIIASPLNKDELWVSSLDIDVGISIFNKKTGSLSYLNHNEKDGATIASNEGSILYKDKLGIIWYGTKGVDRYNFYENRFKTIRLGDLKEIPEGVSISAFAKDKNILWIGTVTGGVFGLDMITLSVLKHIDLSTFSQEANRITYLDVDQDHLWIGTTDEAYSFKKRTGEVKKFSMGNSPWVNDIARLKEEGAIWFATGEGLFIMDVSKDKVTDTLLYQRAITGFYEDKKKNKWIGTVKGLFKMNGNKPEKVTGEDKAFELLANSKIGVIEEDERGRLYMATSSGIAIYDTQDELRFFNKSNGFAHNTFEDIKYAGDGIAWAVHEKGLASLNTKTGAIKNYQSAEGIIGETFTTAGFVLDDNGDILLGNKSCIYSITPKNIPQNKGASIHINNVKWDDSIASLQNGVYTIPATYHTIDFEFALLNFSNSKENIYEYMLEGKQKDWIPIGKRSSISYSNLPPGSYIFRVRGKSNDGIYSSNIASAMFEIQPSFWQTTWFRLLVLGTVLTATIILLRQREKNFKRKAALKQEMTEAKVKALRAQMNPHFIFNCLNTIDSFVLQNKQEDASRLIQRFSKLSRRILEHTSEDFITVQQELETLNIYLQIEQVRKSHQFNFKIDAEPETIKYMIPPMLLQPFVENAVLHGMKGMNDGKGLITITVVKDNKYVYFEIEDNGIGRSKAMELKQAQPETHKSLSMDVTLQRLEALHGHTRHQEYIRFTDHHNPRTGTKVEIVVPLKNESDVESSSIG